MVYRLIKVSKNHQHLLEKLFFNKYHIVYFVVFELKKLEKVGIIVVSAALAWKKAGKPGNYSGFGIFGTDKS